SQKSRNHGDALPNILNILVMDVEKDLLAVDEHRLDPAHLIVEPLPELNQIDAPPLGEKTRLEQVLPEVAEEFAVVGAVEVFVRQVADVPDPVADDVVPGAAQLADGFLEDFERHLRERLGLGL